MRCLLRRRARRRKRQANRHGVMLRCILVKTLKEPQHSVPGTGGDRAACLRSRRHKTEDGSMKRALVSGVLSSCGIAEMTEAAAPCRPQRLSAGRRATRARAILRSTAGTRFPPLPAVRSRPTGQVDFRSWCISGGERDRRLADAAWRIPAVLTSQEVRSGIGWLTVETASREGRRPPVLLLSPRIGISHYHWPGRRRPRSGHDLSTAPTGVFVASHSACSPLALNAIFFGRLRRPTH